MAVNCFRIFLFMVVLVIIPEGVNCLSCYTCTSQDSWADCNSKMTKKECPSGSPNCAKSVLSCTFGDVTKTVFYKRCGAQGDECSATKADTPSCPTSTQSFSWSISTTNDCCTGNNCNSGQSHKFSIALTGVSIVLVFWGLNTFVY